MADRMERVWSPFTNLGFDNMPLGDENEYRIFPSGALETSQDRTLRSFTVTRILMDMQFNSSGTTTFLYGVRLAPESEAVGMINPGTDQTVDWMLWGGVTVTDSGQGYRSIAGAGNVHIDNRSQRKSRGMDSSLRLYVYNAAGSTGQFTVNGRVLSLVS